MVCDLLVFPSPHFGMLLVSWPYVEYKVVFLADDRKERESLENIIQAIGKKASVDSEEPRRVSTVEPCPRVIIAVCNHRVMLSIPKYHCQQKVNWFDLIPSFKVSYIQLKIVAKYANLSFDPSTIQHDNTAQWYSTMIQHDDTAQWYSTMIQHDNTARWYSTIIQHDDTTRWYNTMIQK